MKRLLLPLLTCSLLAACGSGTDTPPDTGTGGLTVSGRVLLPSALAAQGLQAQSVVSQNSQVADWSLPHVPGEVLVVGPGTLPLPGTLGSLSLQDAGPAGLRLVRTPAGEDDQAFAARLTQAISAGGLSTQTLGSQGGLYVQPNYIYRALSIPNDPGYPASDAAHPGVVIGGSAYDQDYLTRINALGGWNVTEAAGGTPTGAVTAVLDTGADKSHPELKGRLLTGYDFANNDNDTSEALGGDVGHGTASAGLIGATGNNAIGITGLTWSGQNILPVKVFDDNGGATTTNLAKALDYAVAQGAKVINMSLGMTGQNSDKALAQSLQSAASKDAVLVAAAGNTASDGLYFPASDPNVLAVGALGRSDDLACYSARPKAGDKALDLVVPGGDATQSGGSCSGNLDYGILSLAPVGQSSTGSARVENGYGLRIGTSEAAPLVSGAASLLRGLRPDLTATQVKAVLTGSAKTVAGGKLLDVGAALNAAACLTSSAARPYSLTVSSGTVSKTFSGTLAAGASGVAYSLSGLASGQQTLTASLQVSGGTCTGTQSVNVTGSLSNQNIQTR